MNSGLSSPSLASHINQLSVCLINTAIVRDRPQNLIYSGASETPFTAGVTGPSVCCPPSLEPPRLELGVTRLEWARRCEVGSSNKHIKRSHAEALRGERLHLKMVCVFNGGDCLRQTASAETHLVQVTSARSRMKCKAARTSRDLALDETVNLLVYFVGEGVRLLRRWIRLSLNISCPGEVVVGWVGENCDEVDLDNGNLSITISQLAVRSITELPAWLPVIIY